MVGPEHYLILAAALLGAMLTLGGCVSDEQAVNMGIATACDGNTSYAKLGDPAGRYLTGTRGEVCKGPKRDAGNRRQLVVIDCTSFAAVTATVSQQMADQRRHGPDFDRAAAADAQLLRLKLGFTDLAGLQQGLQTAEVPFTATGGQGAEQCRTMGATAS